MLKELQKRDQRCKRDLEKESSWTLTMAACVWHSQEPMRYLKLVAALFKKELKCDATVCSLGWNCYPGWLLRDLYAQPAFPWDWMQFFDHAALSKLLTSHGIDEVVSAYSVKNVVPGLVMDPEKPHFWNERLRIRSPHDHEKHKFTEISSSRNMISEKLLRRLERLRRACKGRDLIFLCNYNPGCYGLEGYLWSTYLDSMREMLELSRKSLSPAKCSVVLCGRKRPDKAGVFDGELFDIERLCEDIYYCATKYDFEDAYFKKTPGEFDIEHVRDKYWASVLPQSFEAIKSMN